MEVVTQLNKKIFTRGNKIDNMVVQGVPIPQIIPIIGILFVLLGVLCLLYLISKEIQKRLVKENV